MIGTSKTHLALWQLISWEVNVALICHMLCLGTLQKTWIILVLYHSNFLNAFSIVINYFDLWKASNFQLHFIEADNTSHGNFCLSLPYYAIPRKLRKPYKFAKIGKVSTIVVIPAVNLSVGCCHLPSLGWMYNTQVNVDSLSMEDNDVTIAKFKVITF